MPRAVIGVVLGAVLGGLVGLGCASAVLEAGQCVDEFDCELAEFCLRPAGDCRAVGICSARPQACTREYLPVCGCDAVEYPNECGAHAAGESVDFVGGCKPL